MAQCSFWLRELEFQVDYPAVDYTGDPMTVYGVNTGIRILDTVAATQTNSNSANINGILYGGVAVHASGVTGDPYVTAYVYLNKARTQFASVRFRHPNTAATTLTVPAATGDRVYTFADGPVVAPYGLRVTCTSNAASAGTISVDLFAMESEHGGSSR
jgi:hypothetical protein